MTLSKKFWALFVVFIFVVSYALASKADSAKGEAPKKVKGKCKVLSVTGFPYNDWINTWMVFWKHNASCSSNDRKCFTKMIDPYPQIRQYIQKLPEQLRRFFPNETDDFGNLGYMKWANDHWYISSNPTQPSDSVYAQIPSKAKAPPSGAWQVYDGQAMAGSNVTVRCIGGSWKVPVCDGLVQYGPLGILGFLAVYLVWAIGSGLLSLVRKPAPPKVDKGKGKDKVKEEGSTDTSSAKDE